MLKYGFIGVGQVGGSVANLVKSYNYPSFAINTAKVDLGSLKQLTAGEKMHLVGYEGAGKDRSVGLEAFLEHVDAIKERVMDKMNGCHVIFPVFALGGGTGSGMAPEISKMLTELFPDKIISPICFMPDRSESPRAKMNALESFSQLSQLPDIGAMFVIDNKKVQDQRAGVALIQKYEVAKEELVSLLHAINEQTSVESPIANLDEMDLLTVFSARGNAVISELQFTEEHVLEPTLMGERIAKSWLLSPLADVNPGLTGKLALVASLPKDMTTHLKLESVMDDIGKPLEIFTGIVESKEPKLMTLATGMMYPGDILKELEEEIAQDEKRLLENFEKTNSQTFNVKNTWSHGLQNKRRVKI